MWIFGTRRDYKGNLPLKRQYTIENSKLINFNDVDTVSNDELLNLDKAIPVIRHGEKVEYTNKDVLELVSDLKNKYKTVALITKTQEDSNILYDKLEINLINLNYDSNINILPSYLSKGLEFDSVIIINKNKYKEDSIIDMKLLYVSMTRALHKLIITI